LRPAHAAGAGRACPRAARAHRPAAATGPRLAAPTPRAASPPRLACLFFVENFAIPVPGAGRIFWPGPPPCSQRGISVTSPPDTIKNGGFLRFLR
jgi:hypothetical protein